MANTRQQKRILSDVRSASNWAELNEAYCPNNPLVEDGYDFETVKESIVKYLEHKIK